MTQWYMTAAGATTNDGTSFAKAFALSNFATFCTANVVAGDTIHVDAETLAQSASITVPAGVTLTGDSETTTVFSGAFSGAMVKVAVSTATAMTVLENLTVKTSYESGSLLTNVGTPSLSYPTYVNNAVFVVTASSESIPLNTAPVRGVDVTRDSAVGGNSKFDGFVFNNVTWINGFNILDMGNTQLGCSFVNNTFSLPATTVSGGSYARAIITGSLGSPTIYVTNCTITGNVNPTNGCSVEALVCQTASGSTGNPLIVVNGLNMTLTDSTTPGTPCYAFCCGKTTGATYTPVIRLEGVINLDLSGLTSVSPGIGYPVVSATNYSGPGVLDLYTCTMYLQGQLDGTTAILANTSATIVAGPKGATLMNFGVQPWQTGSSMLYAYGVVNGGANTNITFIPAVASISPSSGPVTGGTTVTISLTGSTTGSITGVNFGASAATGVHQGLTVTGTLTPDATGEYIYTSPTVYTRKDGAYQIAYDAVGDAWDIIVTGMLIGYGYLWTSQTMLGSYAAGDQGGGVGTATVSLSQTITAVSPARSPGMVDVTVTTSGGVSQAVAADEYTYTHFGPPVETRTPNVPNVQNVPNVPTI
jgi:hypothetical protein